MLVKTRAKKSFLFFDALFVGVVIILLAINQLALLGIIDCLWLPFWWTTSLDWVC